MTKKSRLFLFLCAALFFGTPLLAHAQRIYPPAFSLPAWIQAGGTVAAVVIALAVMIWQYRVHRKADEAREKRQMARDLEQESSEMRSLLCSARHELAFFYMSYKEGAGEVLEQIQDDGYLEHTVPVEHERYYIYPICASNIGKVKDALLGRQILFAYTMQIKFIETMKWNNNLLRWLREERKRNIEYQDADSVKRQDDLLTDLKEHFPKMKAAFNEMEFATKTILEYINEDGTINPRSKHKLHSRYNFLNSPQSVRYK